MSVPILPDSVHVEELMRSDEVTLVWNSDSNATLPEGSFVVLDGNHNPTTINNGERYYLLEPYTPTQKKENHWRYELVFVSRFFSLSKVPFYMYTYEDEDVTHPITSREPDWSLTAYAHVFLEHVCRAIYNETGINYDHAVAGDLTGFKTVTFNAVDIISALSAIANAFETEFWLEKYATPQDGYDGKIHLSFAKNGTEKALTVGANVNVPSVSESGEPYYNRFVALGSTRNIVQDYKGANVNAIASKRLTLDPANYPGGYIDFSDGGKVYTKILQFDGIYPSATNLVIKNIQARVMYELDSETKERIPIGTSGGQTVYSMYTIWYVQLKVKEDNTYTDFQFDDSTYDKDNNQHGMVLPGLVPSLHFNSGPLNGRDFEVIYHKTSGSNNPGDKGESGPFTWNADSFEIVFTREGKYIIPDQSSLIPTDDNKVVLFNVRTPQEYYGDAYSRLEQAALKEINDNYIQLEGNTPKTDSSGNILRVDKNSYQLKSNPVAFNTSNPNLKIGDAVLYSNSGYTLSTRVTALSTKLDYPVKQEITIGNSIIKGTLQELKEEAVSANTNIDLLSALNVSTQQILDAYNRTQQMILNGLADDFFEENGALSSLVQLKTNYSYLGPKGGLFFSGATLTGTPTPDLYVDTVNGQRVLRSPLPLITGGDQIVIDGDPQGGGGGGGATYLYQLEDVASALQSPTTGMLLTWNGTEWAGSNVTGLASGNLLSWDGSKWTTVAASSIGRVYTEGTGIDITGDVISLDVAGASMALGLGDAATYGVGSVASGNTGLVTGGAVHSAINDAVASALKFQGITTTAISDGSTTNPVTINNQPYTAKKGDVVLYDGKEYLWTGSAWEQLGDEASWALKTTTISTGTGLTGGGSLAANRTISLNQDSIDKLALAASAYQKPSTGIPLDHLESGVQTSLGKADTALQSGDIKTLTLKMNKVGNTDVTIGSYTPTTAKTITISSQNIYDAIGTTKYAPYHSGGYVTIDTAQTISGKKTFSHAEGIVIGSANIWWDSQKGALRIDQPLITEGDQIVIDGTPGGGGGGGGITLYNYAEVKAMTQDVSLTAPSAWAMHQFYGDVFGAGSSTIASRLTAVENRATSVSVTQVVSSGTKIATVTVDSVGTDLYAPNYSLPIASASVLGGVKVGSGLSIDASTGVLTATYSYTLPLAANGTRGGIQIGYTTSGKNYAVQLSSEKAYVNVPWTDTTYSNGTGIALSGTVFSLDVNGAKTALGLESMAYETATNYVPKATAVTISANHTFSTGLTLNTASSWSNTDRALYFSAANDMTNLRYYNVDSSKGLTYNPSSGALKAGKFVMNSNSGGFLKADGTEDTTTYVPSTRTVNGKALSSNITLSLDDVSDGSSRSLANYVLKAGDTMTGTLKRSFTATDADEGIRFLGGDYDNYLLTIAYSSTTANTIAYGYGLKYIGSGSGVANALRLMAGNQNGTPVTAIGVNQNGQIGILTDADTSYALKVNGVASVTSLKIGSATITWNSNGYLHIDKPLVTEGDQIVISGTPGGGGSGSSYLNSLEDVFVSGLVNNDILVWDETLSSGNGGWKNVAATSVGKIYSAGTGISLGGTNSTVINHSNSVTAKTSYGSTATTASANGGTITVTDVKYDAQGHITASTDRTITLSQVDTKNTAGADNTTSKIFLVGPTAQTSSNGTARTYSNANCYASGGKLYSNAKEVVNLSDTQALTNKTYNGYTLAAACAKGVTDNSSNADVTSSDTNLITGRTLYYQLAKKGYTTNTGTVTKVSTGTGLTGGDITTSGTISINSTYQTYISNGNTAYGWGNHASAGYLTSVTLASGTNNGTLKLTVNGTATDNIAVKGLGTMAYESSGDYVSAVSISGNYLRVRKNGSNTDLTIPYATLGKRLPRYTGTNESGGYDLNTLLDGGGITSQYGAASYWANGPSGMSYGAVAQINASSTNTLCAQFAWDINHNSATPTRRIWWRSSSSTHGFQSDWHQIYDSYSLTKSVITGLLDAGNGTYLNLAGGTMTGDIKMTDGKYIYTTENYIIVGVNSAGTSFFCGTGYKASSEFLIRSGNINLTHRKFTTSSASTDYTIWDASNSNLSTVDWAANNLTVASSITLPNNVSVLGTLTDNSTTVNMVRMSTADNIVIGATSFSNNVNLCGNNINFYAGGSSSIATVASTGLSVTGNITVAGTSTFKDTMYFDNRKYVYWQLTDGTTNINILGVNNSNQLLIGYGMRESYQTTLYGNPIKLNVNGSNIGSVDASGLELAVTGGATFIVEGTAANAAAGSIIFRGRSTSHSGFKIGSEYVTGALSDRQRLRFYVSQSDGNTAISWEQALELDRYGNVTIGTSSKNKNFTVYGNITSTGDQVVSSDATLKTNWRGLNYGVTDIAKATAGVFDWKDGRGSSAGTVAQDWKKLVPELVHGEEGNMTLAYGQVAMLNTILLARHESEQDKEIRDLKNRVAELEQEVERLRMN